MHQLQEQSTNQQAERTDMEIWLKEAQATYKSEKEMQHSQLSDLETKFQATNKQLEKERTILQESETLLQ